MELDGYYGRSNVLVSSLVSKSSPCFDVKAFGAAGDGVNDDSGAVMDALRAAYSAGGGIVFFPAGTYLIASQITFPNDGAGPPPHQKAIRVVGAGSHFAGIASPQSGASVLNCTYAGTVGKFVTYGLGSLSFEHLSFKNTGTDSLPFIYTTNTTLFVQRCSFVGSSTATPLQDAIVLGGQGASVTGDSTGYFQGYGTVIDSNYFDYIQRGVLLQVNANAVVVRGNTWWTNCAGSAAIEDWNSTSYTNAGLFTSGNLIEMAGYTFGISLHRTGSLVSVGDNFYDGGTFTSYFNFSSTVAEPNLVVLGFYATGSKLCTGAGSPSFLVSNADAGYLEVRDGANSFASAKFKAGRIEIGGGRFVLRAANDDEVFDFYTNAHQLIMQPSQADGSLAVLDNASNTLLTCVMPDGTFTLQNNNPAKYTLLEIKPGASQSTIPLVRFRDGSGNINTNVMSDGSMEFGAPPTFDTNGFGNGASGTAVTTTAKGTGTGPAAPQTVVKYIQVKIAGVAYWLPLMQ